MPKSTEGTVFIRFSPTPSHKVRRHQLEDIFSEIGPIKKTSWIHSDQNASKGYGFVKYLSDDDANSAVSSLNGTKIQMDGVDYRILVELASLQPDHSSRKPDRSSSASKTGEEQSSNTTGDDADEMLKKKSRIILRNLSFYAKETQIRSVLEKKFGKIVDVHLPRVQSNLHVGFCFVTFANPDVAKKAVDAENVDIHKRKASIAWSLPKKIHQQQMQTARDMEDDSCKQDADYSGENIIDTDKPDGDSESNNSGADNGDDVENLDSSESDSDSDDKQSSKKDKGKEETADSNPGKYAALKEGRTVFIRNLPFDTNRNDLFHIFTKFGYVESIYLVKDKDTGMLKGTAFVTFKRAKSAQAAVAKESSKSSSEELPEKAGKEVLVLKGRKIFVDVAVDKETAETFDSKEHNMPSGDRRNMYLQSEARVESTPTDAAADRSDTWDEIPESDQKKRQSALKDKTTKLQSPIFFINPNRLCLRNLAKHVDEVQLRTLCEQATKKSLLRGLVTAKDLIAHLRALGEHSTRQILEMVQEKSESNDNIVPPWDDTKKSKDYIPSVFIDRDFNGSGSKSAAASRGFGFVEFTHHVHALACLRELNNNPAYSREYAAGGKVALDLKRRGRKVAPKAGGEVKIPRLIVDFTVRAIDLHCTSLANVMLTRHPCFEGGESS